MDIMLQQLKQDMQSEKVLRRKRANLEEEYRNLCSRAKELATTKQKETDDVTRLKKGGIRNLLYQVTGVLQERLEKEQKEAAQAEKSYAQIQQEIAQMEAALRQIDASIRQLSGSQQRYHQYIAQKAKRLQSQGISGKILQLQQTLQHWKTQEKHLLAQKQVLYDIQWQVTRCIDILEDASGLGLWDMGGGGILSSYLKQERIQEAKEQCMQLKWMLERAKEVQEKQMESVQESIGAIQDMRFLDLFLDNFFTDWSVQDHIQNAISQLHRLSGMMEEKLHRNLETLEDVRTRQKQLQTEWENCIAQLEEAE